MQDAALPRAGDVQIEAERGPAKEDSEHYTFIDLGASSGGSLDWASNVFGGRGLGVDSDPEKISKLRAKGFDGVVADASQIDAEDNCVKYVTMMHFLEHLPDRDVAAAVIDSAVRLASDFVFMTGPDFDDADYLGENGLRKHYADWTGHLWHHTTKELSSIIRGYGYPHCIIQSNPIQDSNHRVVLPLSCPRNHGFYDPGIDPPKPFCVFDRKIFCNVSFILTKRKDLSLETLCARAQGMLGGRVHSATSVFPPLYA